MPFESAAPRLEKLAVGGGSSFWEAVRGGANTPGKPASSGQPSTGDAAQQQAQPDQAAPAGERKVRTVGPQFYPVR